MQEYLLSVFNQFRILGCTFRIIIIFVFISLSFLFLILLLLFFFFSSLMSFSSFSSYILFLFSLFFFFRVFSCPLSSCLVFSLVFGILSLSLSSFSFSVFFLCLCLRAVLLMCVSLRSWCGVCVCAVWCDTLKTPCVHSNRPHVCWQHAHMLFNIRAWCRCTRGRFEWTHGGQGGVIVSSVYQNLPT